MWQSYVPLCCKKTPINITITSLLDVQMQIRRINYVLLGLNVVIVLSISSNGRRGGWTFVITVRVLRREKKNITHSC